MSFEAVHLLYLLWLAPACAIWWHRSARRARERLEAALPADMRARLAPPAERWRSFVQPGLAAAGLALLLFAAARPQWGEREELVFRRGRDLMILLDVSRSMLARDVHPNRLTRAKIDLIDLVRDLGGDRAGLVAFRGRATLVCPLTSDAAYLKQAIEAADIDSAPRGETNIGDALHKALDSFESLDSAHKAILVVSDGEDLTDGLADAVQQVVARGIPIFAVGIGSPAGSPIPDAERRERHMTHDGQEVRTRLDHKTLAMLAQRTGGAYLAVGQSSLGQTTLGAIYREHMARIAGRDIEESLRKRRVERFQPFLLAGILCLLGAAACSPGRPRTGTLRQRAGGAALALLALLQPAPPGFAQAEDAPSDPPAAATATQPDVPPGRTGARQAQTLFRLGRYAEAADAYRAAARDATRTSQADFHFNAALSLHLAGQHAEAARLLEDLAATPGPLQSNAQFNRACALYRAATDDPDPTPAARATRLEAAAEALLASLQREPEADDGRDALAPVATALRQARREAHVADLMDRYGKQEPFRIADDLLREQRRLLADLPAAFTNRSPTRVAQLEELARRQRDLADRMLPLRASLEETLDGADAAATGAVHAVSGALASVESMLRASAGHLRDLRADAFEPAARGENGLYGTWKAMAPHDALLREDLTRQTNAAAATESLLEGATEAARKALVAAQADAQDLTARFLQRIEESPLVWTNEPAVAKSNRAAVVRLANEALAQQGQAARHLADDAMSAALATQRRAAEALGEVARLLPPPPPPPPQPKPPPEQEEPPPEPPPESGEEPSEPPEPPPENGEESPPEPREPETTPEAEQDMERLIQKALQREEEYKQEKKRIQSLLQMPGVDRDW